MDHYEALKVVARKNRERVIAAARKEYNETLAKIDALRYLIEPTSGLEKPIIQLVQESIPEGRPFTSKEIALSLKGVIPDQSIARGTVKSSLQKLCAKGIVRRNERLGNLTYFVSADYKESPIEHEPIRKLLEDALREADKPLRLIEIAVRVKDASKFAKVSKKNIISTVFQALSRSKDLFVRDADKRWSLV